jgi:hypothetical protein
MSRTPEDPAESARWEAAIVASENRRSTGVSVSHLPPMSLAWAHPDGLTVSLLHPADGAVRAEISGWDRTVLRAVLLRILDLYPEVSP